MLQQTTVAAVTPRFERFLGRWPTVEALASAPESDVLQEWAGLGYYARARNLHACAREVAQRGAFPASEAELRKLPGIGDYTAAAIAAIAFGQRAVVVDSNVERIIARLFALPQPSRAQLRALADNLTPQQQAGDFAQAMMDLGALVCRPRRPACDQCPLRDCCAAFASGTPEQFPARKLRRPRPLKHGVAYWTERNGEVRLVRRPRKGLLGGMPALPGSEWNAEPPQVGAQALTQVRHVFTHFALELTIVAATDVPCDGWWQPIDQLDEAGLPTLYRRAAEAVLAA